MSNEEDLRNLEIGIEQAKKAVAKMDSINKLTNNKDFKDIILEGYFEKEASRLVLLRADPAMQTEQDQNNINNAITAIGHLRLYLMSVLQTGRAAANAIHEDELTREEILAEDLSE